MAIEIVPYAPEHLPLVRRFAEATWPRPRSEAHYRWRYEEARDTRAFLALEDGECMAMVRACRRLYRIGATIEPFLETFDWYTRPDAPGRGLGAAVMQRCMQEPERSLQVGGTAPAYETLKRLGWSLVCTGQRRARPLRAAVARAIARRLRLRRPAERLAALHALLAGPRRRGAPRGARVVAVTTIGAEVEALQQRASAYGTVPLWSRERLQWLAHGFPAAGHFVPLYFVVGEELLGWALLRIHPTESGASGELVELFEPRADVDLQAWMVAELCALAAGFGADVLGATTTCAVRNQALDRNGFGSPGELAVHAWLRGGPGLPGPHQFGSNTRDTPINPFPSRWWGDPSCG
jgi:hypothetical protein